MAAAFQLLICSAPYCWLREELIPAVYCCLAVVSSDEAKVCCCKLGGKVATSAAGGLAPQSNNHVAHRGTLWQHHPAAAAAAAAAKHSYQTRHDTPIQQICSRGEASCKLLVFLQTTASMPAGFPHFLQAKHVSCKLQQIPASTDTTRAPAAVPHPLPRRRL
jgi:hypothetical protein